jgi:hypothetical protein
MNGRGAHLSVLGDSRFAAWIPKTSYGVARNAHVVSSTPWHVSCTRPPHAWRQADRTQAVLKQGSNINSEVMEMRNLAALMLLGVSGVVLAQGAQQGGSQSQQPRQQQGAQPGSPTQQGAQQSQRSPGQQQSQVPSFDSADTNKDGQLSRTEANDIDGFDFSEADVNDNASIDRQEYMAAMSATQRPGAGSQPGAGSRSGSGSQQPGSQTPRQQ